MARKKVIKSTTLKSLDDVNSKLGELRNTKNHLKKIEGELNVKRTDLEDRYKDRITNLKEQQLLFETDLELWAVEHKEELKVKRSWDLQNGVIGFWQSKRLVTIGKLAKKEVLERVISMKNRFKKYLKVKQEVDWNLLKTDMTDKVLSLDDANELGVALQTEDNFQIKLEETEINKN